MHRGLTLQNIMAETEGEQYRIIHRGLIVHKNMAETVG